MLTRPLAPLALMVVLAISLMFPTHSHAEWTLANPIAPVRYKSVSMPTNTHIWAGHELGSIWHSDDGGLSWFEQVSWTGQSIEGIAFTDSQFGTAVEFSSRMYRTFNGGQDWDQVPVQTQSFLFDAEAVPGTQRAYACGQGPSFDGYVQWTEDGWETSQSVLVPLQYGDQVFLGGFRKIVVTSTAIHVLAQTETGQGLILRSEDGGQNWSTQYFQPTILLDIAFHDDQHGLATANTGQIVRTENGGDTWYVAETLTNQLNTVGWASLDEAYGFGLFGFAVMGTEAGQIWTTMNSPTDEFIWAMDFSGNGRGVAVGDEGTVLLYGGEVAPVSFDLIPSITVIPPTGGTVAYSASLVSSLPNAVPGVSYWTEVTLPNGQVFGPLTTVPFTLAPMMNVTVPASQAIPGGAPGGDYLFHGHVGFGGNPVLSDSFPFEKLGGAATSELPTSGWTGSVDTDLPGRSR